MDNELETMLATLMALKGLCEERNPYLQRYAAVTLGKLKDPVAFEALVAALRYEDPALREAILGAIGLYLLDNDRTTQQYDEYGNILTQTVEALQPWTVEHLINATQNSNELVRAGAEYALGQVSGQLILSFAIVAEHADPYIREYALAQIKCLVEANPEAAIPRLLAHPVGRRDPCADWIIALGVRAADPLISLMTIDGDEVRTFADELLLDIGLPVLIPLYNHAIRIKSQILSWAGDLPHRYQMLTENLDRLREIICSRHTEEVRQQILQSADPLQRRALFETFTVHEGVYSPETAELFALLIDDPDPVICSRCAVELAKLHDPRALPRLIQAIKAPDEIIPPLQAVGLLAPYESVEITQTLFAAIESTLDGVAFAALELLGHRQDQATVVELIRYHMRLSPPERRRLLLSAQQRPESLGTHLDRIILNLGPRIIKPCIACFADADANVRLCAVRLVGQMENPHADKALLVGLESQYNDVVNEVVKYLYARFDFATVPALLQIAEHNASAYIRSAAKRILGLYFTNHITGEAVLTATHLRPEDRCKLLVELHGRGRLGVWDVVAFATRYLREHPDCSGAREVIAHQSHLRPATGGAQATPPAEMVRPAEEPEAQKRPFWQR